MLLVLVGIDRSRVEDMENRLKQDVLKEAVDYNNQILVAHENDDFQVIEQWEAVTEVDVQTPLEVYRELSGEHNIPSHMSGCQCGQHLAVSGCLAPIRKASGCFCVAPLRE